jgi:disulfide bond formation protein DsbB
LESKLNGLIFARWLPEVFEASGFCFDKYQPILGLDLPTWSLLGLGLIFCLAVIQLLNQKN